MTGIADVANFVRRPLSRDARDRLLAAFKWWKRRSKHQRFVVLAWRRTGSNLLCGMLHNHPEITMHNELFNNIDVFTYHPREVRGAELEFWSTLARDTNCEQFLDHIWSACDVRGDAIRPHAKAVGFKSFPEHWKDGANEDVFERCLLRDPSVKKVLLRREDELRVYVSIKRAERTGHYMKLSYGDVTVRVEPAAFQAFVDHYRFTFREK